MTSRCGRAFLHRRKPPRGCCSSEWPHRRTNPNGPSQRHSAAAPHGSERASCAGRGAVPSAARQRDGRQAGWGELPMTAPNVPHRRQCAHRAPSLQPAAACKVRPGQPDVPAAGGVRLDAAVPQGNGSPPRRSPRTAAPGAAGPLPRPRARTIPFFCRTKVEPFTRLDTTATLKPSDTAAGPGFCAAPSPAAAPTAIRIAQPTASHTATARAQRCRQRFCAGTAPRCAPRPPGAAPCWAGRGDGSRMTSYHRLPPPLHIHTYSDVTARLDVRRGPCEGSGMA